MATVSPTGTKPKPPPKPRIQSTSSNNSYVISQQSKREGQNSTRSIESTTLKCSLNTSDKVDISSLHSVLNNTIHEKSKSSIPVLKKVDKPPLLPKPQIISPSNKLSSLSASSSGSDKSQISSLSSEGNDSVTFLSSSITSSKVTSNGSVNINISSTSSLSYSSAEDVDTQLFEDENIMSNYCKNMSFPDISHLSVFVNQLSMKESYSFFESVNTDCDFEVTKSDNRDSSTPVRQKINDTADFYLSNEILDDNMDGSVENVKRFSGNEILHHEKSNSDYISLTNFPNVDRLESTKCDTALIEIQQNIYDQVEHIELNFDHSNMCNLIDRSRSSSITTGSDCSSVLKPSPRNSNYESKKENVMSSNSDLKIGADPISYDDDSIDDNSENSYNVSRRIKSWFSSFGKGGGGMRRKKRDSVFYLDPEDDIEAININTWDTGSLSSAEDRNCGEGTTYLQGDNMDDKPENKKSVSEVENEEEILDDSIVIEDKKRRKAYLVVRELISTERDFIGVLKLLCLDFKHYIMSADEDNPVISEQELMKIINYLPQLLSFNEDLLKDLEARVNNWLTLPKISDIIIKKGPFLKLHSTYIQNFKKQCDYLDECCHKYPRFLKTLKEFEGSDRCKKLTIKHYMLKPIQRIPQYKLLLQNYLNHQDPTEDSVDYKDTEQALRIVCDVADHADKSVQVDAHMSKLLQVQSQLGNYEIIKPGREFIKAGELNKLSRKGLQLKYFILLNDCLIYTSYYGSMISLKVNYELSLAGMKISIPTVEDYHNEFSVISTTRSFILRARSEKEREIWVMALRDTIKENSRRQLSFINPKLLNEGLLPQLNWGKVAPIWVPDDRVTMCQSCTAEFKVTFRRHHCRSCGKVVCGTCSDNKAPLQYMNFRTARVCDDCYAFLLKEFEESDIINIIKEKLIINKEDDLITTFKDIRTSFKKHDIDSSKKLRKNIPQRLKEVMANDTGSMSGWLHKKSRRTWKHYWFVLKEQVLYVYKASEDVRALQTIPVLGYTVETFKLSSNTYEDIDSKCVFQLAHINQEPVVFYADNEYIADKWVAALEEATNLR